MGNALQGRVYQLQQNRRHTASEAPGELPDAVIALVDNKAYLPRHRRLQRDHGSEMLLKLVELAATKERPSRWYAKVTSVRCWERTLKMLKKLIAATKRAGLVMEKVGADASWLRWYTSVAYRNSEATVAGWAELAARGRSPVKYFGWLAAQGK